MCVACESGYIAVTFRYIHFFLIDFDFFLNVSVVLLNNNIIS